MALVAVASGGASPGVTSTAFALGQALRRHQRLPVLLECDPMGGVLTSRWGWNAADPSLTQIGARGGVGNIDTVMDLVLNIEDLACVVNRPDPATAFHAVNNFGRQLSETFLASDDHLAIADLGRIHHGSPARELAGTAELTLVIARPRADEVARCRYACEQVEGRGGIPGLVVIGDRPLHPDEFGDLVGFPMLPSVVSDPELASVFEGGRWPKRRALERSALWRTIEPLAARIDELAGKRLPPIDGMRPDGTAPSAPVEVAGGSGATSSSGPPPLQGAPAPTASGSSGPPRLPGRGNG